MQQSSGNRPAHCCRIRCSGDGAARAEHLGQTGRAIRADRHNAQPLGHPPVQPRGKFPGGARREERGNQMRCRLDGGQDRGVPWDGPRLVNNGAGDIEPLGRQRCHQIARQMAAMGMHQPHARGRGAPSGVAAPGPFHRSKNACMRAPPCCRISTGYGCGPRIRPLWVVSSIGRAADS